MENLHIDFISGSRRYTFQLNLLSYIPLVVGGIPWSNTYNIQIDNDFFSFWGYVKKKYGTLNDIEVDNPKTAIIEQKKEGVDNKGYPWNHKLTVKGEMNTEVCIFFPYVLGLLNEIEQEENSNE